MELRTIVSVSAAAVAMAVAVPIFAQEPGLAVEGSVDITSLPHNARKFIAKHFPSVKVVKCERNFFSGIIDVDLSDGTDLEFDSKGEYIEIEAGRNRVLPEKLVKETLPHKAYKTLVDRGKAQSVETIKRDGSKGYKVELRSVDDVDYLFTPDGTLRRVKYD